MPDQSEEQEDAEAEVECFKEELGPFVVATETTRMPMVFTDAKRPDNPVIFANDSFISLIGYGRKEVLGQSINFLMASGNDAGALAEIKADFEDGSAGGPEICCRRKDGSEFWAGVYISPVRDKSGEIVQHFVSLVDLTWHKQEQARSGVLIDELNHRVRNTLAAVQSIVSQAFRKKSDPAATREFIGSRIAALSRFHALLAHEDWGSAGLRDVVSEALTPFRIVNGSKERYVITGDNIRLPPRIALALGIALHELALNAVIFGAFSNDAGSVLVSWTIEPKSAGDRLVFVWREKDGPLVTPPSQKGLGSRVIERGLAHELQATAHLEYPKEGLICTIDMPASRDDRGG